MGLNISGGDETIETRDMHDKNWNAYTVWAVTPEGKRQTEETKA